LETKRFIGNDMPRIYARVRSEFGPDAVIVETRSLLREGAEPLIEVMAAPPDYEPALPLDLQRALIDGALGRVEPTRRPVTVGDLEDIVQREADDAQEEVKRRDRRDRDFAALDAVQETREAPEWLQGFVGNAPARPETNVKELPERWSDDEDDEFGATRSLDAEPGPVRFPSLSDVPDEPVPSSDWASRPRPAIVTRRRERQDPGEAQPAAHRPRHRAGSDGQTAADSLVAELMDAGLSHRAAAMIAAAGGTGPAVDRLAQLLTERPVSYPDESRTAVLTIQGAAGSGRTTALMRMALDCADSGREAILVAADGSHVAGREQVHAYGEAIGLPVVDVFDVQQMRAAILKARRGACLFTDVPPGPWQDPALPAVGQSAYLALPAHWQADALEAAIAPLLERSTQAPFAGAVLTFTDLATDLSPVLSLVVTSSLGVAFLSSGRNVSAGIGLADPSELASGIFTTRSRESTDGRLVATA